MKIAQISSTFPPYQGGIGNVCYHQSLELARRGHQVTVILPEICRPSVPLQVPFQITYVPVSFTIGNASWTPQLVQALEGFDVLHLHYPYFGGDIFVRAAAQRYGVPYVLTYHQDITTDTFFKRAVIFAYNRLWQKKIIRGAAKVLALSPGHYHHSQIFSIVPADRVAFIPNGVDLDEFTDTTTIDDIRKKRGLSPEAPMAIFIGALDRAHHSKRLDLLLQAVAQMPKAMPLLVVGDGDLLQQHRALADKLGIAENITWLGRLGLKDIVPYLRQSSFLVLPSVNESFGLVLLEAMACHRPVIASDLPGVREVVVNNVNGLLVPPGSIQGLTAAITWMADHPAATQTMGQAGYDRVVEKFQWTKCVDRIESVYHTIKAEHKT